MTHLEVAAVAAAGAHSLAAERLRGLTAAGEAAGLAGQVVEVVDGAELAVEPRAAVVERVERAGRARVRDRAVPRAVVTCNEGRGTDEGFD